MQKEKIIEINNPAFKTGIGKNGKEWTLMQVTTDGNHVATVFGPVKVGDELEMEYNDQYGNWSGKKITAQSEQNNKILEAVRLVYKQNAEILALLKAQAPKTAPTAPVKPTEPKPAARPAPVIVDESFSNMDEPIDLDSIPF